MRMPREFYTDLQILRSTVGEKEYHRDEILPGTIALMDKHLRGDAGPALKRDAANAILDSVEKSEDEHDQADLFPYEAQTALGKKMRIRRGRMNHAQMRRRKRVIDHNKVAQDSAWAKETKWLDIGIDALEGYPPDTVREDIIDEEGKSRGGKAA